MKILYGVQGTGNGHITRARVMASCFNKLGIDVDYVFSGRANKDYFDMHEFSDYKAYRGLSFSTENGQVKNLKTLKNMRICKLVLSLIHI